MRKEKDGLQRRGAGDPDTGKFPENRLASITLEMEEDGKNTGNLDEALEALDDAIDSLADFQISGK